MPENIYLMVVSSTIAFIQAVLLAFGVAIFKKLGDVQKEFNRLSIKVTVLETRMEM